MPPAAISAMIAMDRATGPVKEFATILSGFSQGRPELPVLVAEA
jgi:hypothetical protein